MVLFFLLLLPYYILARGLNTLRLFNLSWSNPKCQKALPNSPSSKLLKREDIWDGFLLIVLSLVALLALASLSLYEVGVPKGYKLICNTFLPGLFQDGLWNSYVAIAPTDHSMGNQQFFSF